jgi:hypothetical protein
LSAPQAQTVRSRAHPTNDAMLDTETISEILGLEP